MEPRALGSDLGEAPLNGGVDVLVAGFELGPLPQFPADLFQAFLDRPQLGGGEDAGCAQPAGVGDAAGDVVVEQLEVVFQRARESLELGQQASPEAAAPELYGVSLLGSGPTRPLRSRSASLPWTSEAVRTPWPQILMKPGAADWSNWSPRP